MLDPFRTSRFDVITLLRHIQRMADELHPAEQKAIETIGRVGWMVMRISPNEGDENPRWFAYTVGLAVTFHWPELICFGLDHEVAGAVLNNAVGELRNRAIRPVPGLELCEVLEHGTVRLHAFSPAGYSDHLGWAMWYAAREGLNPAEFSCLQVLWPDKSGRFPGDPACDPGIAEAQVISWMS
jgi:hypothetical protein